MSVLIRGMEMPTSCWDCPCINGENGYCQLRKEYVYGEIPRSCPIDTVPPHGRLIDADSFLALVNDSTILSDFLKCIINPLIRGEPTVIAAEGGET